MYVVILSGHNYTGSYLNALYFTLYTVQNPMTLEVLVKDGTHEECLLHPGLKFLYSTLSTSFT